VFWYTISAIIFTGLLLLFVPKNSQIKFSDNHIFTKLGKISYGLYVYHIVWIHIVYKFYIDYGIEVDGVRSYFVFIVTTFSMTVVTSYISYRFFEKPILGLREKFFSDKSQSIKTE
jgi:peptidoglycan/LPS O-acetylase OafA/YrhL